MDLHQLRVFHCAALAASFTKASAELRISQSTVSLHIKHLEEELGCPLFIRVGRRAVLSPAGELLVMHAEKIFRDVKNAEMDVRETNALKRGTIRLGTVPSVFEYRLPGVLAAFNRRFPQVVLVITCAATEMLLEMMERYKLDLAVVMPPVKQTGLRTISLGREEMFLCLSHRHPLAFKKVLSASDLHDLHFIAYRKNTAMQNVVDEWFQRLGVEPRVTAEVDNVHSTKALVESGLGASILPACALNGAPRKDSVRAMSVKDGRIYRELGLVLLDAELLPSPTKELAALLEESLRYPGSLS
jgi:DNA-binding transcriptional LysR family regulator